MNLLEEEGYIVLRGFYSTSVATSLASLVLEAKEKGAMFYNDHQVDNAYFKYNLPSLRVFHLHETERASTLCKKVVVPTYCYTRVYGKESELPPHRDRIECEYSFTIHLQGDVPWEIFIENKRTQEHVGIFLQPGDAILYKGCEVLHYRKPFTGECYIQTFFHYVDEAMAVRKDIPVMIDHLPDYTTTAFPYVRTYSMDCKDLWYPLSQVSSFTPYLSFTGCTQSEIIHHKNGWSCLQETLYERIYETIHGYYGEYKIPKPESGSHDILEIEPSTRMVYAFQDIPPFHVHTLYLLSGTCSVSLVGFQKDFSLQPGHIWVVPICYAFSYQLSTQESNCKILRSFFR